MNYIHALFYDEIREKKKAANGVHGKTGLRGYVGTMRFPSDLMKSKEKRKYKKGSKVMTYNMNEIMEFEKFEQLDYDQKRLMLQNYRERFTNVDIQHKWGLSVGKYYTVVKELDLPRDGYGRGVRQPEYENKTPEEIEELKREKAKERERKKQQRRTEKARALREQRESEQQAAADAEAKEARKAERQQKKIETAVEQRREREEADRERQTSLVKYDPKIVGTELVFVQENAPNLLLNMDINGTGETSYARLLKMLSFLNGDESHYRIKLQIEEKG